MRFAGDLDREEEGNGGVSRMGPLPVELSQGHQADDTGWGWREGCAPVCVVKPLYSERKYKQVRYISCAYLHFHIIQEQTARRLNYRHLARQPPPSHQAPEESSKPDRGGRRKQRGRKRGVMRVERGEIL